jgi:TQXA domain-containing protein/LPXTG-motif cell wall-anchored protein
MASRLKLAGAVTGASVALMLTAAIPAGAEPVTGKVSDNGGVRGYNVDVGRDNSDIEAKLFGFELADGTNLQMYCVEINTPIDRQHNMVEQPWGEYPNESSPFNENSDKINWVLHNGYPVVGAEKLTTLLTEQGAQLNDGIDAKEAISATQAAVWHYSDGTALNEENPLPDGPSGSEDDVVALYKYLTGADNVGLGDQPAPALAIAPGEKSGKAGEKIGPFTVTTTGDVENLTAKLPDGVTITDADGNALAADAIENGTELYLDVPAGTAEGKGTFEVTATASVGTGRLFVGENYDKKPTQSLIVAKAEKSEIVATATGSWAEATPPTSSTPPSETTTTPPAPTTSSEAPAPQPKNTSGDLAQTGASVFAPIVIGVVLIGAGIGALLFLRHRKRA